MTDAYSFLLAIAAIGASSAWLLLLASRRWPTLFASKLAAATAIAFDGASVVVHLAFGHRAGTSDAMTTSQFVREHPAFAVVAAGSLLALGLATKASRHARRVA